MLQVAPDYLPTLAMPIKTDRRMPRLFAPSLLIALALALGLAGAMPARAMPANATQLQAVLRQAVQDNGYTAHNIVPVAIERGNRELALAVLDRLDRSPAYREAMQRWITAYPVQTQEDMLFGWMTQYHAVLEGGALDFIGRDDMLLLWRLTESDAVWSIRRAECKQPGAQAVEKKMQALRIQLLQDKREQLADAIANAFLSELRRESEPYTGPDEAELQKQVDDALAELKKPMTPKDRALFEAAFSVKNEDLPKSAAVRCEASWVISHAFADMSNPKLDLLRKLMTGTSFGNVFDYYDKTGLQDDPPFPGFKPGDAPYYWPRLAHVRGVSGNTLVEIRTDETGTVTQVDILSDTLEPKSVTSADGTVFKSSALFFPMLDRYFRAGTFAPTMKEGKAVADKHQYQIVWKLED